MRGWNSSANTGSSIYAGSGRGGEIHGGVFEPYFDIQAEVARA
jgi:hypothetical protein